MAEYPYVSINARDAGENPISVKMQASSDSAAVSESDIITAVTDHLAGLTGVTIVGVTRYQVTETPL